MGPGGIAAIAVIGLMLLVGGAGKGGAKPKFRDDPLDPELPGTGPIDPGPNNQGPKPSIKGPGGTIGWGGGQYGPGPVPDDFDWNGSLVYISEDCKTIAEPLLFLPIPGSHQILFWWMPTDGEGGQGSDAQESLIGALMFIGPARDWPEVAQSAHGTAWGYIANLVYESVAAGEYDPVVIATTVLSELIEVNEADCGNIMDTDTWSPALQKFFDSLVGRIAYGIKTIADNYDWAPEGQTIPFDL